MIEVGQIWHSKGFSYLDNQYDTKYCSSVYLRIKEKSQTRENAWVLELSRSFGGDFGPSGTFDHTEEDLRSNYVCMDNSEDYYKPIPAVNKIFNKTSRSVSFWDDKLFIKVLVCTFVGLILLFLGAVSVKNGRIEARDAMMESKGYTVITTGKYYQKGDKAIAFVSSKYGVYPVLADLEILKEIECKPVDVEK